MTADTPLISFALPAFNEREMLEEVVNEALTAARQFDSHEILIIDDGSTDGTGAIADRLAADHRSVRVVHHPVNRGFSGAMLSCVENARATFLFMGPADGQAQFDDVSRFWAMTDTHDLIFSNRVHRGDSARRKLASTVWYTMIRVLFGTEIPEFSSLFLFRRDAIPPLAAPIRPDASNFLPVLYLSAVRSGARVGTIGIDHGPRRGGTAKGGSVSNAIRTIAEDVKLSWRLRHRRTR
jgi:glycosyltransferase involved in cell wall biosynthesis